jgi:hypothetical protein
MSASVIPIPRPNQPVRKSSIVMFIRVGVSVA